MTFSLLQVFLVRALEYGRQLMCDNLQGDSNAVWFPTIQDWVKDSKCGKRDQVSKNDPTCHKVTPSFGAINNIYYYYYLSVRNASYTKTRKNDHYL